MERIIAAAYLVKPEYICDKQVVYKVGAKEPDDIYQLRIGRHHAEIVHMYRDQILIRTAGFYTSYGRYVNRREAAKIALSSGQCKKLHFWNDKLDSSDIFDYDEDDNFIIGEKETMDVYEIEGHKVVYSGSNSGSLDPWTAKYADEKDVNLFCTSDMASFVLVDDDLVYRLNWYECGHDTIKDIKSWYDFELWLKKNAERDFGSLRESLEAIDKLAERKKK